MSKNPAFMQEMVEFENEKFEELLSDIKPQVEMIKAQAKMIGKELKKYKNTYSLDFEDDVFDYLKQIILKNI